MKNRIENIINTYMFLSLTFKSLKLKYINENFK